GMVSVLERLAQGEAQAGQWDQASHFLDRLQNLAPDNALAAELRKDVGPKSSGPGPSVPEEESTVPSLDELERVVELDSSSLELEKDSDTGSYEIEVGESEGTASVAESRESPPDSLEVDDDEDAIREQEAAYSGKSVIQEMRSEPGK